MTSWRQQKLVDIVTFRTGKLNSNAAVEEGKYPFFTCSQEIYKTNTWNFDTECVLLGGNNASAIYPIFYFKGKFDAYQRTYIIEPKYDNNIRYIYYLLREKLDELKTQSTGATTKFLTLKILNNIDVSVPESFIQNKLVSVLSAYDDLIGINEKRIKILEEITERLYNEWFIKFKFPSYKKAKIFRDLPLGWSYGILGDRLKVFKGRNITEKTIISGDIPVVAGGLNPAYYHNVANVKGPVITISASGANAGFVKLYYEDIWASDCSYINKDSNPSIYFYYLLLKAKTREITNLQKGAAQPHVYPKDLTNLPIVTIPDQIIIDFNSKVEPLFDLISNLHKQIEKLVKTRDLLIPPLVTGKRVLND